MKNLARRERMDERIAWLMILPFVLIFAIFKLWPLIYGVAVSFLDRNSVKKLNSSEFIGFANYIKVLVSSGFWRAFGHSLQFSVIYTVVLMAFSFLIANLFNEKFCGRTVVRTCFYIPYVTNMIAVGIVFKYLLNPVRGPVNAIFRVFGCAGPKWLASPEMALTVTALIGVWVALAFNVITILAALQDIPKELFEVADIEGATNRQRLLHIVLPLLKPALFMLLTITVINSFKNYTTIIALTNGGPGNATRVLSLQIYEDAFHYMKFSIASAEGVLFTLFIVWVNHLITRVRGKEEL